MTQHDLKPIIEQLRRADVGEKSYFGIYEYLDEGDVVYVRANKQGLQLFAAAMLEAVDQYDDIVLNSEAKEYNIDGDIISKDSMPHISHIKFVAGKDEVDVDEKETLRQKVTTWGLFAILIFLLVSMLVGLITIFTWVF